MEALFHCPNGKENQVRQLPEDVRTVCMGYHSSPEGPNLKGLEAGDREGGKRVFVLFFNSLDDYDS